MELLKKLRRRRYSLNSFIAFVVVVIFVSCLLVMLISVFRLPEVSQEDGRMSLYGMLKIRRIPKEERKLGDLGKMMLEMLPDDLAFTVFVPSEKAFRRDLKLKANNTLNGLKENDNTYATISRILGFSAVPQKLHSVDVPFGKEISLHSISGFKLYVSRRLDGSIVVNRVHSARVDLRKGEIVVHIMNGVIMDADFEQSVEPDDEAED
ncbi:hypothetical protein AQUCO_04500006v1 [Aquilegia coerulea]|uniref:FAS1 domain-containing protein n=1 Tax=Aquilegia coerulea TaxID=218851 RepID=A0A2G5CMN2_AQUCA|nr:hypothetical protein AQUCO_04500006v1 [Aquilegia coerulea]